MVFEVYGNYVAGLEEDFWNLLENIGKDFVKQKVKKMKNVIPTGSPMRTNLGNGKKTFHCKVVKLTGGRSGRYRVYWLSLNRTFADSNE